MLRVLGIRRVLVALSGGGVLGRVGEVFRPVPGQNGIGARGRRMEGDSLFVNLDGWRGIGFDGSLSAGAAYACQEPSKDRAI